MSVQISIDRPALAKLIADDPQFELNLKTAVLSEVARRFFARAGQRAAGEDPDRDRGEGGRRCQGLNRW